jgi:hypothetical protein
MISRTSPNGRFIYYATKSREKLESAMEDGFASDEFRPSEIEVETIRDHRGRIVCYAITMV